MPIPLVKDPVVLELENIVLNKLAMPCSFVYANLFEANYGLDQLTGNAEVTFPMFLFIANPSDDDKINVANDITRKVKIMGMFLTKYEPASGSIDYKSTDVEPTIYQMMELGRNLMHLVNKSYLSNADGGTDAFSMRKIYQKFDGNLFGCSIDFTWSIDTVSSGYLNRAY